MSNDVAAVNTAWIDAGKAIESPVEVTPPVEAPVVVEAPPVIETPPVVEPPAPLIEYVEAKFGEEIIKIPKGAEIQIERKGEKLWVPVETMRGATMMEHDYQRKTEKLASERREYESREQSRQAEAARVAAYEKDLQEREINLIQAMGDPAAMANWEQHQLMLATNPVYKQAWTDSQSKRQSDAELATYKNRDAAAAVQTGVDKAVQWLGEAAERYPTVNVERVRQQYARDLADERATLDPTYVEGLFKAEAEYLAERMSPVEKQLAEMRAQITALQATPAAVNALTQHAVNRAKTPPVAPSGSPPSPVPPARKREPVPMRDMAAMNERWSRGS